MNASFIAALKDFSVSWCPKIKHIFLLAIFYTFFYVKDVANNNLKNEELLESHRYLRGKTLGSILHSQCVATQKVFKRKKIGKIETGEIFGELSLILNENRTASIKAIVPSEIVEIKRRIDVSNKLKFALVA